MSELYCTQCGSELEPGSTFCPECGAPVEDQVMPPSQQSRTWPIFVVVAIVVVAAIVAIVLFMQGGEAAEDEGGSTKQEETQSATSSEPSSSESSRSTTPSAIAEPPMFTMVSTSSVLAPDKNTSDYSGASATDGILDTAWNEGSSGDGTGEWIELIASTPQHVSAVSIVGGYPKIYRDGSDVYYKNNRPRQITISYDGGSQTFMMQDLRGQFQTFTLDRPVDTTFVRITIESVYKGANYNDCCISEIEVS